MTVILDTGIARRENGVPPPDVPLADIDLGSLDFWAWGDDRREGAFATLRREAPIKFFDVVEMPGFPTGAGHWALTKHEHVHFASRNPELFSSSPTSTSLNDVAPEISEYLGSMITLDDPRHLRLRSIVNRAFTPKVLARIEQSVRDRARQLVADMREQHPDGRADFVEALSGPLPLQIICDMMGIPEEDESDIFHWTTVLMGTGDDEASGDFDDVVKVVLELGKYGVHLAESRRTHPTDDLTTNLVNAEVDGERLTTAEIESFFILLLAAGNETTRNAISHGMVAMTRYPDERAKWFNDFDACAGTAVEEIVRWASPIIFMRRNLTADYEMGGVQMKAGDKVSMWYNSANRDESVFANPWMFDITRNPNPQIGFGAGGAHFCLGANLARREVRVLFDELRMQVPDIVATEEPAILRSAFVHGIKRLPVAWTP
ncbi:cytochrome P450 [Mycolicibacterium confluentis]|uniref:Steroid C26-monooxygenase n=1 Tax=Mycolicibacterium confluentis TaxID=28047 RepID=A0A7I7Y3A1_9MYCO|nr:cytochrome P450 [Mycolicibacterium confluentis]MCV7318159.1 cytochrome P450 [Mycolicibacterium confluentis]ORV31241.1 cytochrome [Mycolicibacterium confluentis]BBZ36069.1 methyl-branched lipid omega-hydroxylase [Mycolicibacterium confluentis]